MVVTGLQLWKGRRGWGGVVHLRVDASVHPCVLMKWREALVLQGRGRDAERGSERRVNWI